MIKKFIFALLVSVGVCFLFIKNRNTPIQDFTLENIEAIGSGESGNGCYSGGSFKCGGQSGYSFLWG